MPVVPARTLSCRLRLARLIEGGLPTETTSAQVLISKYADLDRSPLADWVVRAAWHLRPVYERLLKRRKASSKLFPYETTALVLDLGRGKRRPGNSGTALVMTDHGGGSDPQGVAYI